MSSATISRRGALDVPGSSASAARLDALGPSRRFREFEAGNLSRAELFAWAARYPEEVPLVNGELPWIVIRLADLGQLASGRPLVCEAFDRESGIWLRVAENGSVAGKEGQVSLGSVRVGWAAFWPMKGPFGQ